MTSRGMDKQRIKRELADCLGREREVLKVVVFGSFLSSPDPQDIDVAVFEESNESYLPLAMKYRRLTATIADRIPLDIIPIRTARATGSFLAEVEKGEVIYER